MAEANNSGTMDLLTCSVCLDILKDPVTTPCGHNYCMDCITGCWDQAEVYRCPQCRETFTPQPVLCKNTLLAEVIQKLKKTRLFPPPSRSHPVPPEEVECDLCSGKKLKAVTSCLTCQASFCDIHIQPHYEQMELRNHRLACPVSSLQGNFDTKQISCQGDETCFSLLGMGGGGPEGMEIQATRAEKQAHLEMSQMIIQRRIQETEINTNLLRQAMNKVKVSADREIHEIEKNVNELIRSVEEMQKRLTDLIKNQETNVVKEAEGLLERLELEMDDLQRRDTELVQLLETDDHIHFLQHVQSFPPLSEPPRDKHSSSISISADLSSEVLRKELASLKEWLDEINKWEFVKISESGSAAITVFKPPELRN